jgi:hypothetical protein
VIDVGDRSVGASPLTNLTLIVVAGVPMVTLTLLVLVDALDQ